MMAHSGGCLTLASMAQQESIRRLEVTFVGAPPARQVALASGVSEVEVNDHRLRCLVEGSVQPFLEALYGSEVMTLTSSPALSGGSE
jgi:hypothetical protein